MLKYLSAVVLICIYAVRLVQSDPLARITRGRNAFNGQFPHQIYMTMSPGGFCGGSIISRNFVLTAAHCVKRDIFSRAAQPSMIKVFAGSNLASRGVQLAVHDIIIHEGFRKAGEHDIALLKLAKQLTLSKFIRPISLSRTEPRFGASVVISGYGATHIEKHSSYVLQWAIVKATSRETCKAVYRGNRQYRLFLGNSNICLKHENGAGACFGDSGGPATFNNQLVGVCSFGIGNCGSTNPDGYTSVSYYLDWIRRNSDL